MTAELRALNARFINNFVTNDVPSHDAILHKDFICINPAGARVSRADYMKAWSTGFDAERIPYYDYRDEVIDVFGAGSTERTAAQFGLEFLGAIELDPAIREGGDKGLPVTLAGPDSKLGKDFFLVAARVAARAKELAAGAESVLEIL